MRVVNLFILMLSINLFVFAESTYKQFQTVEILENGDIRNNILATQSNPSKISQDTIQFKMSFDTVEKI